MMVTTKKSVTIQDVARRAQVSTATVSRALSSPDRVSEATRLRVSTAVLETGYTLNEAARSLRLQKARNIVIALPNVGNPYYSTILDSVVSEAGTLGYGVLVANRQAANPTGWLRDYFFSSRADGLLLFDGQLDTIVLRDLMREHGNLPIVVVSDEIIEDDFSHVTSDNWAAAGRAVQHLVALGHERLAFVTGPTLRHYRNERLAGFTEALERNGLYARSEWIIRGDHTISSGFQAGSAILAMQIKPTGIVCSNDEMAIGVISRLHQAGWSCPRDFSVIGFDDIDMAQYVSPGLTTLRQKRGELGRLSTAALIESIEGRRNARQPFRAMLRCELVVRGSTAPPPPPGE